MVASLGKLSLLLVACVAGLAQAAHASPSATLNIVGVSHQTGAPIDDSGIQNGDGAVLSIQYEISGLDEPAHLEISLCNVGSSESQQIGGSGARVYGPDPRCPPTTLRYGWSDFVFGPTISPPNNSQQSVTGVFTFRTDPEWAFIPDGYVWTIPVSLVLESSARTLLTQTFPVVIHASPKPDVRLDTLALSLAKGPDGVTPGFNVQYRINPWNNMQAPGDEVMWGTSFFDAPVPAGAKFVSASLVNYDEQDQAAVVAAQLNSNRGFTYTLDPEGVITGLTYHLDNVLGSPWIPTENNAIFTLWYPLNSGGLTTMINTIEARWANGFTESRTANNVMGSVGASISLLHTYSTFWDMSPAAANDPLGHWLNVYSVPGAPIGWDLRVDPQDDGSGSVNGSLISPVIINKLPPQQQLLAFTDLTDSAGGPTWSIATVSISTNPGCGVSSADWVVVDRNDTAALGSARCFKLAVDGLLRNIRLRFHTQLLPADVARLVAQPGFYEFEDDYFWVSAQNLSGGFDGINWLPNHPVGYQTGSTVAGVGRMTEWNAQAAQGGVSVDNVHAVGSRFDAYGRVPWGFRAGSMQGFDNLTFAQTLPLELDLDGPPHEFHWPWELSGFAFDVAGNDWAPTCTWGPQIRAGNAIQPAWYRCSFAGHFPSVREDPLSQAICHTNGDPLFCFERIGIADDNNRTLFNEFRFAIPMRVVAGTQGESVPNTMRVWSDNAPASVEAALPGTSESTPYLAQYGVALGGTPQMILQKSAPATTLPAGGSITYTIHFQNSGDVGTTSTHIYDLFGRDSRTGAQLPGCETPRFVSAAIGTTGASALIEYTTDGSPTPGATWSATAPAELSTVTGLRISPQSAFSSTSGVYSPTDAPLDVQVTVADTAGTGARLCNSASLSADGFAPTLAAAGNVEITAPVTPPAGSCVDVLHVPTGQLLFEDLYPANGDLDYNDQAFSYSYDFALQNGVTEIRATFNALAVGAKLDNGLFVHLPGVPRSQVASIVNYYSDGTSEPATNQGNTDELTFAAFACTRANAFGGAGGYINTDASLGTHQGRAVMVVIKLSSPLQNFDTGAAPFDPFLARCNEYPRQIHLPEFDGSATGASQAYFGAQDDGSDHQRHYVNKNGLPFALALPDLVAWPQERVAIDAVYPDIMGFASSAGQQHQDWYQTNVNRGLAFTHGPAELEVTTAPPLNVCGTGPQ